MYKPENSAIVVFTGPSLHPSQARTLVDATFLPPVKRGDLAPLLESKPRAVGIVDGEFYQSLAVAPKEVLALMESGVAVYGSSSMGALRAVELEHCGMTGVGAVFRLFRRGIFDSDDEVALAYSKETYHPLSEPLINTRFSLRAAVRRCLLDPAEATEMVARIKAAYFPERTRALLISIAREIAGCERALKLRDFLATEAPNVKRRDAKLLMARIQRDHSRGVW
jgi:hypothetical protein